MHGSEGELRGEALIPEVKLARQGKFSLYSEVVEYFKFSISGRAIGYWFLLYCNALLGLGIFAYCLYLSQDSKLFNLPFNLWTVAEYSKLSWLLVMLVLKAVAGVIAITSTAELAKLKLMGCEVKNFKLTPDGLIFSFKVLIFSLPWVSLLLICTALSWRLFFYANFTDTAGLLMILWGILGFLFSTLTVLVLVFNLIRCALTGQLLKLYDVLGTFKIFLRSWLTLLGLWFLSLVIFFLLITALMFMVGTCYILSCGIYAIANLLELEVRASFEQLMYITSVLIGIILGIPVSQYVGSVLYMLSSVLARDELKSESSVMSRALSCVL